MAPSTWRRASGSDSRREPTRVTATRFSGGYSGAARGQDAQTHRPTSQDEEVRVTAVDSRRGAAVQVVTRPRRTARQAVSGLRRADQAAHHRAAARHHRADDVARRGRLPSLWLVAATLVGGTLAAGSANTLNCYLDRDIDQVMHRTERRPLATGLVSPREALVFGLVLGVVAVAWLAVTTGWLPAVLALAAIAFYVVVYTMALKRRTPQNIVWGGAAGCMPVLIGWSAVTGSLSWAPRRAVRASSSSGRRRTTGRCRCASATTTPPPGCRCSRSSPTTSRSAGRSWPTAG